MLWQAFIIASIFPINTYADYLKSRFYQNCDIVETTIYCFGGIQGPVEDTSGNIYKIDLRSVGSSIQASQMTSVWTTVTPTSDSNLALEGRHSSVVQYLGDKDRILISGDGATASLTVPSAINNVTVMYHTSTNTLTSIPAFRNVLDASGVYLPYNQRLFFYGGSLNTNLTAPGYPLITYLNLNYPFSWTEVKSTTNAPVYNSNYIIRGQTATFVTNKIYFLGGRFTNGNATSASTVTSTAPSFQTPYIFDTLQSIWIPQVTMGGDVPPSRFSHTATLLPNSNKIFIFGGARVSNGNNDDSNFSYVLNLDTNTYTHVNLSTSPTGLNSRYGHSALLSNTTLFILFGRSNGLLTDHIDIIDVSNTDPEAITWSSVYPPVEQKDPSNPSSKSNAGTIAGATVGSIAGVAIIAGAIFFFVRKKKRENNKGFDDYSHVDYSHGATYETTPRPMKYTAEVPDMETNNTVPPVYYGNKPEENINQYNEENFLKPQEHPVSNGSSIKPDEVDSGDQFQKPNRYEQ